MALRNASVIELLERRVFFAAHPDVVIEWNDVLIDTLRADRTRAGPGWSSRAGAMVHAAIYDAINAIDGGYEPYLVDVEASKKTSMTAAAAAAGWRVLSELYPMQQARFDDALQTSLARVKDGQREDAGVELGVYVAERVLASRVSDGAEIEVPYTPGTNPGDWRPTFPDFGSAWGPGWGEVKPFAMDAGDQFRPPPPPSLASEQYTNAYNEVKLIGAKNSATRTADQTETGIFWGYDRPGMGAPPAMYNQIVQTIAGQRHNTMIENARLFALANLAMADAGIAAWDCKYIDNFWRPITGIREGDFDGNDDTDGDPTWEPLGAPGNGMDIPNFTPPFPAYVSGHATFGAAVFQVLADFYGTDRMRFTVTSDELPGVTRSFRSFTQAAQENGVSRIYLGIHWNFDNTVGQALGRDVAGYVIDNMLQPVKRRGPSSLAGVWVSGQALFSSSGVFSATRVTLDDAAADDLL